MVTDCTTYGPGPGTLATAVETDGLVTFACSGTIVVKDEIPVPERHLAIDGSGQAVILSGGNQNRLFNVGAGSSLQLHKLTLTAGNAGAGGGGAIASAGHLTITNSALLSNTAAYGGALEIYNGSALIQNTTFAGNGALDPAEGGGAINQYFNFGDGNNNPNENPNVVIQNSTFAYNYAAKAGREGIWQENGKLQLRYNVIAHNGAGNCKIEPPTGTSSSTPRATSTMTAPAPRPYRPTRPSCRWAAMAQTRPCLRSSPPAPPSMRRPRLPAQASPTSAACCARAMATVTASPAAIWAPMNTATATWWRPPTAMGW